MIATSVRNDPRRLPFEWVPDISVRQQCHSRPHSEGQRWFAQKNIPANPAKGRWAQLLLALLVVSSLSGPTYHKLHRKRLPHLSKGWLPQLS